MATQLSTDTMNAVLAAESYDGSGSLEDYDTTSFLLVSDGESWQVLEDSLEPQEAEEWAEKAAAQYGELMGFYHHTAS